MRNGNKLNKNQETFQKNRSYPTYEEWKLNPNSPITGWQEWSSYPTYEEWKHSILRKVEMLENSSYPTYEEWKPS